MKTRSIVFLSISSLFLAVICISCSKSASLGDDEIIQMIQKSGTLSMVPYRNLTREPANSFLGQQISKLINEGYLKQVNNGYTIYYEPTAKGAEMVGKC